MGRPLDWSGTRHVVTPGYGYPGLADIAEAINSDWRKIGVEIKIDTREFADFIKDILRGSLGGSTWAGNGGYDESPNRIGYHFYSGRTLAGVCCHYFEHEVMDDNYEAFVESTDPAEQDRLLRGSGRRAIQRIRQHTPVLDTCHLGCKPQRGGRVRHQGLPEGTGLRIREGRDEIGSDAWFLPLRSTLWGRDQAQD